MPDLNPTDTPLSQVTSNTLYSSLSHVYTGTQYAITGAGGYSTVQGIQTIERRVQTLIEQYDTTGAVEVLFDVRIFNDILGIQKDSSNINILTTGFFNSFTDQMILDTVTIPSTQFLAGLNSNTANIISVGKYSTLYSEFSTYVIGYFGLSADALQSIGFGTLFSGETEFNSINGGVFDASAFMTIISGSGDVSTSGAYINDLSGSIVISNITKLLRNAVDANPFGNRTVSNGLTAADPNHRSNYGVSDGFFENDLIFIPTDGITIALKLAIDTEGFPLPLNNVGTTIASPIGTAQDASFNSNTTSTSSFSQTSTSTTTLITRTSKAPLLIRLMNLSHVAIILSIGTVSNTSITIIITSV